MTPNLEALLNRNAFERRRVALKLAAVEFDLMDPQTEGRLEREKEKSVWHELLPFTD